MSNSNNNTVFYLPGAGGQLVTGLGQALRDRGFNVTGRETRDEFRRLGFEDQLQIIRQDLQENFWHEQARVVCNSYGSYLFLHAQSQMAPFPGRVLMHSLFTQCRTPISKGGFHESKTQSSTLFCAI